MPGTKEDENMRNRIGEGLLRWVAPASLVVGLALCACSSERSTLDQDQPDYVEHNQKPVLVCSIQQVTGDTIGDSRVVSSDPRLSKQADNFTEGDSALIDCSQSTDDSTAPAQLTFELSLNYDTETPAFQPLSQKNMHRLELAEPGRPIMALRATDDEGASTTVPFTMVTQCADGTRPSVDEASVSVSSAGALNMYSFTVNTADFGPGAKVSLDFDGDGVFDAADTRQLTTWTTASTFTKYVPLVGERRVGLKVANACELESSTQIPITFAEDNLPRVPGTSAIWTGFPYIQFNLQAPDLPRLGNEAYFLFTKGEVVWSEVENNSNMKAFAVYKYSDADSADSRTEYRVSATISGFSDGCGTQGTHTHNANIEELSIHVPGGLDGVASKSYQAEDVPAKVTVQCLEASYGCNGGSSGRHAARRLLVEIPTATLMTDQGESAELRVGLISADRGTRNYTCGGGGGGGGSGPPGQ